MDECLIFKEIDHHIIFKEINHHILYFINGHASFWGGGTNDIETVHLRLYNL